jgi:hypothetical protein
MAAKKSSAGGSKGVKQTFGKRKLGSHAKSYNKHNRKEKNYRGQGR